MTTAPKTTTPTKVEVVLEPPAQIFTLHGLPVFITTKDYTLKKIAEFGYPMFYAFTNVLSDPKVVSSVKRPALFKVINNVISFSTVEVPLSLLEIDETSIDKAVFKLPELSWEFTCELEAFFRAAYKEYGTESIVMLTYDEAYLQSAKPSDGWGYYVPKQTNSSTACDYNRAEVLEHIEEIGGGTMVLAGSAHSHPQMAAYASHTDEKDQEDFEGLHLTCGWFPGKSAHWYAELRAGGRKWTFDVSDIFEDPPLPTIEFPGVEIQLKKIEKEKPKVYTPHTSGPHHGGYRTPWENPQGATGGSSSTDTKSQAKNKGATRKHPKITVPSNCPDPRKNFIIQVIDENDTECRLCTAPITSRTISHRRCYACNGMVLLGEETIEDVIAQRESVKAKVELNLDPKTAEYPIVLWHYNPQGDTSGVKHTYECLYTPTSIESEKKS